MKAIDPRIIEALNDILKAELTAINQYFLHAEMCENWGYLRLAAYIRKESIDEMKHAETLIERILFLEGTPNVTDYFKINIGKNVQTQLENDLSLEYEAVPRLNKAIAVCIEAGDNTTREIFEHIVVQEEEHIDWLEAQLGMIGEIGIANYLTQQMHKD